MRIAVVGPISTDSLAKCIIHTLLDMGHEVISINPEKSLLSGHLPDSLYTRNFLKIKPLEIALTKVCPKLENYQWSAGVEEIARFQPNLVLSTLWDIPTPLVERMKQKPKSTPVMAVWCPDALTNFGRQYLFAAPWDFLFFKDKFIVDFCREKLELNAHLLPLGCYPKWHRRVELSPREKKMYGCDITIAGSLYYYRAKIFESLQEYNMKIWGLPVRPYVQTPLRTCFQGKYVGELEKAKAFRGAAIVLNNMHYAEILGLNQRVFDACGCGAFQMVDDSPVLADYFIPGKELVAFKTMKELQELVPYYLNRPQEREQIAEAGYARAHLEHTFHHRLEKMFSLIVAQNGHFKDLSSQS